jgi:osmotically-inducible protein OsmY
MVRPLSSFRGCALSIFILYSRLIAGVSEFAALEVTMSLDGQLQEVVLAVVGRESSVIAAHHGVAANGNVGTLIGRVQTLAEKHAAGAAAPRTADAKSVSADVSDGSNRICCAQRWSRALGNQRITVTAAVGNIHLTGISRSPHARQAARATPWAAAGATSFEKTSRSSDGQAARNHDSP